MFPAEDIRVQAIELARLGKKFSLTVMVDGWDDAVRRSLYGTLACERGDTPSMLGLEDLTGQRGDAVAVLDVVEKAMKGSGIEPKKQVIAAVSDDPNTMRKYRRLLEEKYPGIIVSFLFPKWSIF